MACIYEEQQYASPRVGSFGGSGIFGLVVSTTLPPRMPDAAPWLPVQ